jgi:hypothetical protein
LRKFLLPPSEPDHPFCGTVQADEAAHMEMEGIALWDLKGKRFGLHNKNAAPVKIKIQPPCLEDLPG